METYYRPTRAEISLDALRHNIGAFRSSTPEGMKLLASVKANAYGHGLVPVSREAEACGADYLGVAFLDEAVRIRRAGIAMPILVLGYVPAHALGLARSLDITIALYRDDVLEAARSLPMDGSRRLKVHVKLDTGMGRLGRLADGSGDAMRFIEEALRVPQLHVEGMFTHFAKSDEADKSYTELQYARFAAVSDEIRRRGLPIGILHSANTAAGMDTPELGGDMLRLGIGMYGLYPSDEVDRTKLSLQPVLSLKSELVHVKALTERWGISYGTRYFAERGERIGTIPIGYADGFSRLLTGKAHALVRGQRVPVAGTICMDQCMVALDAAEAATGSPIAAGEEAVLIGRQKDAEITAEELAAQLGTINYEITCMLASRVPRVYVRGGEIVEVENPLSHG
ncbi:alanine racemase [Paenibacillus albicereus]|uniref:Alanine racemase n=1 Tax=Paenibacillus albicereus TaxID=2726185 RepID=A0A6H2GVM6_9BACL|nr:alanine racemase [Paenibacillus albicereus]QJC51198.1 alanine racemase [Paenibacillus albicereus]